MTRPRSRPAPWWSAASFGLVGAALWLVASTSSAAAGLSNQQLFAQGAEALGRGAATQAIDAFELLADRGFRHPDASYDLAAAYLARAATPQTQPGDLGRAVAALEEAALLRPGDDSVGLAIERIREEIARRRAARGASAVLVHPSLGRAVVGLVGEDGWAIGALVGSLALSLGLVCRLWLTHAALRLTGSIVGGSGLGVMLLCTTLASAARHWRVSAQPAVVIASEARLLDEQGEPLARRTASADATLLPEGASVEVLDRRAGLAQVRWGDAKGWIRAAQLRLLERP